MEGWACSPPAVHRRALSPVPAGDCAGLKLPGSALNPVATHLCRSFLLRAKPLCRLTATQNIQGSQFNHQRLMEKTHSPSPQILLQMALSSAGAAQGSQDSFYCLPGFSFPHPASLLPSVWLSVHYIPGAHTIPCVHVCICVYMYADVCLYLCANMCAVYTCVNVSLYACIYLCVHLCACICMCVSMCACVYLCICVCVYLHAHVCMYVPCARA